MSFPLSPTNGQTAVVNGITYQYSTTTTAWSRVPQSYSRTTTSTVAPVNPTPVAGDQWYNTTNDTLYRYTFDGVASYWVDITGAPSTTTVGQAQTYLGETTVTGNITPTANAAYSVGSNTRYFSNLYVVNDFVVNSTISGNVYVGGYAVITGYLGTSNTFGFKNRIINGAMMIDQRNAGATVNASTAYPVDRFYQIMVGSGVLTSQRSTTAPAGFTNSLLATVTTVASSIASGDYYGIGHRIEGFNCADLAWGTASAQSVSLSFWVRSSVTGTYSVALYNGDGTRSYIATYTINSANTFEYKTITVSGDTTGTWVTNNGVGMVIFFDLGSGSGSYGTAGAWAVGNKLRTSGSVNLISTNGATFYITGVQLEPGPLATSFDYRPYGTELALCQRYTYVSQQLVQAVANPTAPQQFPVTMRATPTFSGGGSGFAISFVYPTSFGVYQTTGAIQTLTASAEL
jgi:hypothetical protein